MFARRLKRDRSGSVVVEFGLLAPAVIVLLVAIAELSVFVWQWNNLQRISRAGARMASLSAPVSSALDDLRNTGTVGTAISSYFVSCDGSTQTCSSGNYDSAAMNRILTGGDGLCARQTQTHRRGICDMMPSLTEANILIEYASSLNEVSGAPGGLQPIITLKLKNVGINYTPLSVFGGDMASMPMTSSTVLAQDMSEGGF